MMPVAARNATSGPGVGAAMYVDEADPEWPLMWAALRASDAYRERPDQPLPSKMPIPPIFAVRTLRGPGWRYTHTNREHAGVDHCFVYMDNLAILDAARIPVSEEFAGRPEAVALVCWLTPRDESIEGAAAFRAGEPRESCRHKDPEFVQAWRAGWDRQQLITHQ